MNASDERENDEERQDDLAPVDSEWGKKPEDHFGYDSDEERLAKRGMEDWELVDKIPESQRGVPKWFLAVVAVVLLVAVGLSFPFWGDRPGYERSWFNWGFVAALLYIAVAATFVYFMVTHGSSGAGSKGDPGETGESGKAESARTDGHRTDRDHI